MNKILTTPADLQRVLPTTIDGDSSFIFTEMGQAIDNANRWVRNQFIGAKMYDEYDDLPVNIKDSLLVLVGNKAFEEAVPMLDLILTNNGFGVVATNNVAPASKDRVERLIDRVYRTWSNAMDELITEFITTDDLLDLFKESPAFYSLTDSFYLTALDLATYAGIANPTRRNLAELSNKISRCELFLKKKISPEYFNELIDKVRTNKLTDADKQVFPQFKKILGMDLMGNHHVTVGHLDSVMTYIEQNADLYPTYTKSSTNMDKTKHQFKNKKNDSAYFF